MKAKQFAVRYNVTGSRQLWRIWREPRVYSTHTKSAAPCWCWTDHEGYQRNGPETWAEFVPYLRQYFASYDVTPLQDLN